MVLRIYPLLLHLVRGPLRRSRTQPMPPQEDRLLPPSGLHAAEALGMNRLQIYVYIVLPLAFRVSLPALNNNLVNLVKTTTQALAIAVPELLYQMISIYNDYSTAQNACMLFLFIAYFVLVGILVLGMSTWERKLRIPGYGK